MHPLTESQESMVQGSASAQLRGAPPPQTPSPQVSPTVQVSASSHADPSGLAGFEQTPVDASHVPTSWHWSCAVQTTGLPPTQLPLWQLSDFVQASASSHADPSGFAGFVQTPVDASHVPASWHWSCAVQITGLPPTHVPLWQVSD